ncbi:hypothetical protein Poly41_21890 [Novipirellula artificiosorum]|uniref:RNA polymerase sigma factor n=2 Tax=Novipirellula artificiosorum TaxID=2528016 RepID=A0A5C6DSU3_9BACT|nr:hypothetical protein Poly41_21890 [Novipirellula artificiosorum]
MIDAAAGGSVADRETFAKLYWPAVAAYLKARWSGSPNAQYVSDAAQEVFVECFRTSGPLARVDQSRSGGFRPYLYGIARKVALRYESRQAASFHRRADEADLENIASDDTSFSIQFDRAWARTMMRRAAELQKEQAASAGEDAKRRIELLRLRFEEGRPIREIAVLWQEEPAKLHHQYAMARKEFSSALRQVVAFHSGGDSDATQQEVDLLLEILG